MRITSNHCKILVEQDKAWICVYESWQDAADEVFPLAQVSFRPWRNGAQ